MHCECFPTFLLAMIKLSRRWNVDASLLDVTDYDHVRVCVEPADVVVDLILVMLNEVVITTVRTILAFLIMIKELVVKATIIKSPFSHI